jgi:hypothetical protein
MIGVKYDNKYAVTETFQLLKIPWEWYDASKSYDVVIAKKDDVPEYYGNLIDLAENDVFNKIRILLNQGHWQTHLHRPLVEIYLDELRNNIKQYTVLIEIPPSPWEYPYMVALTHDVDSISISDVKFESVAFAALRCMAQLNIKYGIDLLLIKLGIKKEVYHPFEKWKSIEQELGIRSTFFIIPPYTEKYSHFHKYREIKYTFDMKDIDELKSGGWEVGIHNINGWIDIEKGKEELNYIKGSVGNRTHWLMHNENSWNVLDAIGYEYDTTFGYDDDVGYRAGTIQVYQPEGVSNLLELPLHIQDTGLFAKSCWIYTYNKWMKIPCLGLTDIDAEDYCKNILHQAKLFGGVITILWHYNSLYPPTDLSKNYIHLAQYAKNEGAWVTTAKNIVDWFRIRRNTQIMRSVSGKHITIYINKPASDTPLQKVRLHIDKSDIDQIDGEFVSGYGYVDIKCDRSIINVVVK